RAQTPSGPSAPSSTSTVPSPPRGTATFGPLTPAAGAAATSARWTPEQRAQAFKSADKNGNGQLSRQEAAALTGLPRSSDQMDSNKDGSISSAEFDEALK
ncbi:MAG TPA: EF-hand domain-containing protein, partial [Ramlibacter sp.]|nr:EF-hand domain-containing protein [Ramlibacter sp.]